MKMNNILLFVFSIVGTLVHIVQGTVTYGSPYNIYGNPNQVKPHFPEALVTYGPPQRRNSQPALPRRQFYSPQQKTYYPAQTRAYAPVQPRGYAPSQRRTYSQPRTRAYAYGQPRPVYTPAQPRRYASPRSQPYAPVHPQVYSPNHPQSVYSPPQTRTYARPATAIPYGQRKPQGYFMPARQAALRPVVRQPMRPAVRQSINTGIRQPINTAVRQQIQPINVGLRQTTSAGLSQPIRSLAAQQSSAYMRQPIRSPQIPLTRTLEPKQPILYRPGISPQFPQNLAARPVVVGTYGRNRIPKTPTRNTVPGKPIPPEIRRPTPQNRNNNRNTIALSRQISQQTPKSTLAARNYINGINIPQKVTGRENSAPIKPLANPPRAHSESLSHPIKPQVPPTSPTGHKLSTFLKTVKNLQDTLKENTMKQGLIYYDDDVSNKSRHRPTNFAPPTRKLGSMGSPGGSRVTFNEEPAIRPAIIPETKAVNQAGSERVKIAQTEKNATTNNENDTMTLPENTADVQQPLAKKSTVAEKPLPKNIAGEAKPLAEKLNTSSSKPHTEDTAGAKKSPNFATAKVDLGLLKDKVLHSNNSQFLKRVLHVLRKYTKLMKTSMTEKNATRNVLNASIAEDKGQISNYKTLEKIEEISKINNTTQSESGTDLSSALSSTKTAVKMFDFLSNASKQDLKSSLANEINEDAPLKNSTSMEDSSKKSESENKAPDLMSSNSKADEKSFKDENASKKEIIETEKNVGKPVFNVEKLKYGLERGNTID